MSYAEAATVAGAQPLSLLFVGLTLEAQLPIFWVPVLKSLCTFTYEFTLLPKDLLYGYLGF